MISTTARTTWNRKIGSYSKGKAGHLTGGKRWEKHARNTKHNSYLSLLYLSIPLILPFWIFIFCDPKFDFNTFVSFKYEHIALFQFHFLIFYPCQLLFHRCDGLLFFLKTDSSPSLKSSWVSCWRSISGIRFICVFTILFYLKICQ